MKKKVPIIESINYQPRQPISWLLWGIYFGSLLIVFILNHFSQNIFKREFIDFDDLKYVQTMLDGGLGNYFSTWLWNRQTTAFPLRDMTFFLDHWISLKLGLKTFWMTQFLIFSGYLFLCLKIINNFSFSKWLKIALFCFIAFHPYNTEILLWIFNRKYSFTILFQIAMVWIYLDAKTSSDKKVSDKTWWILFTLWGLALLSYANSLFWFLLLVFLERKDLKESFVRVFVSTGILSAGYFFVISSDPDSYAPGLQAVTSAQNFGRMLTYGILALGRGLFNTFFPTNLFPYYSQASVLNFFGLLLVGIIAGLYIWQRKWFAPTTFRNLFFGMFILTLIPSMFVVLSYETFVWADRYAFSVLIFFVLGILSTGSASQSNSQPISLPISKWRYLPALIFILTLSFPYLQYKNAPPWSDVELLMKNCALGENSTKCTIAFLENVFKKKDCKEYTDVLENGAKLYSSKNYFYDDEFEIEMPFYHAACVGSTFIGHSQEIEKALLLFQAQYAGSNHYSLAKSMQHLQMKDPQLAYELAKKSYLALPLPTVTAVSQKSFSYYMGHIQALCGVAKDLDCEKRKENFQNKFSMAINQDYFNLGFQQSFIAYNGQMLFK